MKLKTENFDSKWRECSDVSPNPRPFLCTVILETGQGFASSSFFLVTNLEIMNVALAVGTTMAIKTAKELAFSLQSSGRSLIAARGYTTDRPFHTRKRV